MNWLYENVKNYLYETVHVSEYTMEEMADDIIQMFEEFEREYRR